MKVIVVTGNIGSGKSLVSSMLEDRGVPVYDCDSKAKALYKTHPELAALLRDDLFVNKAALSALENALFPVLMDDFRAWAAGCAAEVVAIESATILQKPFFDGLGDYVIWVSADREVRLERIMARGGISRQSALERMELQGDESKNPRVSVVIENNGSVEELALKVENFLKTI